VRITRAIFSYSWEYLPISVADILTRHPLCARQLFRSVLGYVFAFARTPFGPAIVAHASRDVIGNSVSTDNPKDTQDVACVTGHRRRGSIHPIYCDASEEEGGGGRGGERAPKSIKC